MAKYILNTGIDYLGKRAEAGQIVSDLPPKAIKWLLECDAIAPVGGSEKDAEPEITSVEDEKE